MIRIYICVVILAFVAFSALTVWSCTQEPAMHSGMEYRP